MPSLKMEIGAEIRSADGTLIRKIPFRRCHSLLKQFIQLLAVQFSQTAQTIKDTGGANRSTPAHATSFLATATNQPTYGIVIGTGETAVTMTDYKIETQLTTNIGQGTVTFAVENPNSTTWRCAISRGLTNNTGAVVNIKEVALYTLYQAAYIFCLDRTLYSVTVQAGETVTLTYRITITL